MKFAMALLVICATSAHAEVLVPKGAKGTLTVEYVFTSAGKYTTGKKEAIDTWSVKRNVTMTTQYVADPPQAFGALHQDDGKQKADMATLQAKTTSAHKKLEPMANDVMALAAKCGITMDGPDVSAAEEKAQEACMEKAAAEYGNNMEMTPEIKSAGDDIAAANKLASGTRFQLWRSTSQSGTYSVDETISKQVFEMTCTETKICKRVVTNKGGGAIPGGKSASASMIEVDSTGRDMVLQLPMPAVPLPITRTVTTTMIDDDAKGGPTFASLWPSNSKPVTVAIPGDLKIVSGTQTTTVPGSQSEGGTLTVNWKFTRQ
ncbi:MAG TPA: hypothetical protein VEW08_15465 [Steroidobacteraceae bacterium]|nr:hypothetical protein [Steroidobacteraceae bacterium]